MFVLGNFALLPVAYSYSIVHKFHMLCSVDIKEEKKKILNNLVVFTLFGIIFLAFS